MKKIIELDGLRGLAILFILLYHTFRLPDGNILFDLFNSILNSLWIGVDLFFALSGYLITTILLEKKGTPNYFKNFYARRILRIFPLYFLVLFLFGILYLLGLSAFNEIGSDFIFHFFYVYNYRIITDGWNQLLLLDHFWSLCIEEQFYLVWPILIWVTPKKYLKLLIISLLLGSFLLRNLFIFYWEFPWRIPYVFPVTRLDTLTAGALVALYHHSHVEIPRAFKSIALIGCITSIGIFWHASYFDVTNAIVLSLVPLVIALVSIPLIDRLTKDPSPQLISCFKYRPLLLLGKYSYALYIFHQILYALANYYFGLERSLSGMIIIVSLSITLSLLSYHFVESKFLNLKKHFRYTR